MIRLHVTDVGLSVRVLGVEVAAITDDRTPESARTTPIPVAFTRTPRIASAAFRLFKEAVK